MSTRTQPGSPTIRAFRAAAGMAIGLGAALTMGGAPALAATCPIAVAGTCTSNPNQTLTDTVTAGTLSVTAPSNATLTSQAPGTISAAQPLGAMSFSDTLNDATSWTVSVDATDFSNAGHTIAEIPWANLTFTPYSGALTTGPGTIGTPVTGSAGAPNAGADTIPGTTFATNGVTLVALTGTGVEGTWTTPAAGTGNTITVTVPATTAAGGPWNAIIQYSITG